MVVECCGCKHCESTSASWRAWLWVTMDHTKWQNVERWTLRSDTHVLLNVLLGCARKYYHCAVVQRETATQRVCSIELSIESKKFADNNENYNSIIKCFLKLRKIETECEYHEWPFSTCKYSFYSRALNVRVLLSLFRSAHNRHTGKYCWTLLLSFINSLMWCWWCMKGKGLQMTYWLHGKKGFNKPLPTFDK